MDPRQLLGELRAAALALGVEVRAAPFTARGSSAGGLCRVRGRSVIVLDASASSIDQAAALAEALASYDLAPARLAREALDFVETARSRAERHRAPPSTTGGPPRVATLPLPKPGLRSTRSRRGDK